MRRPSTLAHVWTERAVALLAASFIVTHAQKGRAADPDPPTSAVALSPADEAIDHGVALRKQGDDSGALAEFLRAYGLSPSPRARAQIGLAEQALGHWVDAEAHLQEALGELQDSWIAHYIEPLQTALATVRKHLGWIEVATNVARAALLVDGARAASLPMTHPARVVAGTVVIEVRAPGYVDVKRPVDVGAGTTTREDVTLVPVPIASLASYRGPTSPVAIPNGGSTTLRAFGFVAGGLGLAGLGLGTYFGVRTLTAKSDRDGHCVAAGCDPAGLQFDQDARRDATFSTIGFGAGALLMGVGALLVWRGAPVAAPAAGAALRVQVAPRPFAKGGGVALEGTWW